jgi:hypothetical protein
MVPSLWREGFASTTPLKFELNSNTDLKRLITESFVSKSASLIRMIEASTPAEFDGYLKTYIQSHPFFVTSANYFYGIFKSVIRI